MKIRKSLDKLIAVAGGCLVFATGGGTIAAGAATIGAGASLFNAWREEKDRNGPESERVIEDMRTRILERFGAEDALSENDRQLLEGADFALEAVLLDSIPLPARLAEAFGAPGGFAKAAAALVLAEVAARDDLFAEGGVRSNPLARRFAYAVIEAAMETAMTSQAYFSRLLPFALHEMREDTRATREDMKAMRLLVEELAGKVAVEQGTSIDALREIGLLYGVHANDAGPDEILAALRSAAGRMREMEARLAQLELESRRLTDQFDRLVPPLTEAREALIAGRLDEADRFIAEALAIYADLLQRQAAQLDETKRQMAEAYALQAESARLKLDYRGAAQSFVSASQLCTGEPALGFAELAAGALFQLGTEFGDNAALLDAIDMLREIAAKRPAGDAIAATHNLLGLALISLGEREGGTGHLEEAGVLFRAKLAAFDPSEQPDMWWATNCNLGSVLLRLGERSSGTEQLEEAVSIFRAVLRESVFEAGSADHATTANNLGLGLARLGERSGSIALLSEAISACRAALAARQRDRVPLDWAAAQVNLGLALLRLGELDGNVGHCVAAETAFRQALLEYTQARAPLRWATAQANLGMALIRIGERTNDHVRLEEAIKALDNALLVQRRDLYPLDWSNSQMNRGAALLRLGTGGGGARHLEAAVAAFRLALLERTRERVPLDWASLQNNMANALANLGRLTGDREPMIAAEDACRLVLEVIERDQAPHLWAIVHNNLANALFSLGAGEQGVARLQAAVIAYRAALEEHTRLKSPIEWATATLNLCAAIGLIWDRSGGPLGPVQEAFAAAREARQLVIELNHVSLIQWSDNVVTVLAEIVEGAAGAV